jgi:phage repressor protein C with HTH and peptisase S24 domain
LSRIKFTGAYIMDKQKEFHRFFLDRLCSAVEPKLGMSRHDRGFKKELARALGMKNSTTVQRWFESSTPAADHMVKLHKKFNISPNTLLGIESEMADTVKPLDLHRIKFILASKHKSLPQEFLDPEKYAIGPIVRDSRSASHPEAIDEQDIDSWGIGRKDLVQYRNSVYLVLVPESLGMSMWPIIKPGDIIVIDPTDKEIVDGAIFALRLDNGLCTVRQIKKAGNHLILIPWFLREYQVEMIDLNQTPNRVVGKVICSLTYLTSIGDKQLQTNSGHPKAAQIPQKPSAQLP